MGWGGWNYASKYEKESSTNPKKLYFKSFTQIIYLLEQNMCHKSVK